MDLKDLALQGFFLPGRLVKTPDHGLSPVAGMRDTFDADGKELTEKAKLEVAEDKPWHRYLPGTGFNRMIRIQHVNVLFPSNEMGTNSNGEIPLLDLYGDNLLRH